MTDDGDHLTPERGGLRHQDAVGVHAMTATVIMIMDLSGAGRREQNQYVDCTRFSDCG
jgi:hypothetical protein